MSVSVMADTTARGNPAWKNRPQRLRLIQPFDYSLEAVITNTRQAGLKQDVPRARAFYEAVCQVSLERNNRPAGGVVLIQVSR
ncbi:MAG: hypothetical protein WBO37_11110 [Gammaproteobacteria bacterium]